MDPGQKEKMVVHHLEPSEEISVLDPADEKRVLRKIDLYLMPSLFILYLFSYIDRSNIGLAEVAGMKKDLKITSSRYYLAIAMWVVGYSAGAVPSNMILCRVRPSIYIPIIMFGWGATATGLAGVRTSTQLIILRFFLGVFEAGYSPAAFFLMSSWYKKHEQSKRFMIYLSAGILSGAFGSVFAGAITSHLNGVHGIAGWRWLFLIEGVATIAVSFITYWFILDYPSTCSKLTPEERKIASDRVYLNGITYRLTDGCNSKDLRSALLRVIFNWRVWLLASAYMTIIGALSISNFYPTLIQGLGYSSTIAQYMTAPLYLVALIVAVPVCWFADQHAEKRGLILAVILVILGCLFSALTAGIMNFVARYVFLCFINSAIWTGIALALSFASSALGGADPEVRAIALALMNGCGGLAQLYGSALFPSQDSPRYLVAFTTFAACFLFGGTIYFAAHVLFKRFPFTSSSYPNNDEN